MQKRMLVAAICAFPLLLGNASAQTTEHYNDLVIVLNEPSFLNLDAELIEATLRRIPSTEVIGENVDADSFPSFTPNFQYAGWVEPEIHLLGRPAHLAIDFDIAVSRADAQAIWQRMLEELNERLSKTVVRLEEHSRQQQEQLEARLRAQLEVAEQHLQQPTELRVRFQVENSTSAEAVQQQRQELRAQRQELEMKVAAADARKEAIREQIALLSEKTLERAADDGVGKQLAVIIKSREERLEHVKQEYVSGHAPQTEVLAAEADLAQARIDLLRHQKGEQDAAAAKQIASLNEQLTAVTIDLAESRKLLKFNEVRSNDIVAELENQLLLEGRVQAIEAELAQRREQVQQLQAQLRDVESAIQPRSTVRIVPWNE